MSNCKKIVIGSSAIKYIRECLGNGSTLSHYILDNIDLEKGQVIVGLPENAAIERIEKYELGILPISPKNEWRTVVGKDGQKSTWVPVHPFKSYIIETIHSFLVSDEGRFCVIEDPMAKPLDGWLRKNQTHVEIIHDKIYHLLYQNEYSTIEIEKFLASVSKLWPPLTGFLTSLFKEDGISLSKQKFDENTLKVAADRTEKIFVKGYDGEAYLIWHRFKEIP